MKFETKGMTVGYDGIPLIKDINIELEKGSILTIIGPNGSGKSTILKSIAKQLGLLGGEICLDGCGISDMTKETFAKNFATVLTGHRKTELLTCFEVVAYGRYPYTGTLGILSEKDRVVINRAMEQTDVSELRDKDFMKISDGQQQRVLLAGAVCREPRVILLDEPTNYLDVKYTFEFLRIIKKLSREQGITVIMSMHQLDLAQKISDAVMCVKSGYVFRFGTPAEIFKKEIIKELYDLNDESYVFLFQDECSDKFFINRNCGYFPCHKNLDINKFNCLFCYCPLYFLDGNCGGDFELADGVKSCLNCSLPHKKENYDGIIEKLKKIMKKT